MIVKNIRAQKRRKNDTLVKRAAAAIKYCAADSRRAYITNMANDTPMEIIKDMQAWAKLNKNNNDWFRHIVLSPEVNDRELTKEDWEKAIEIYAEERGLGDAPFVAYLHEDGEAHRHKQHLHLCYVRIKSDGKSVPDSFDSVANRKASRRIEQELGLLINAGADEKHKYNGRSKHHNRHAFDGSKPVLAQEIESILASGCSTISDFEKQLNELDYEVEFIYADAQQQTAAAKSGGDVFGAALKRKQASDEKPAAKKAVAKKRVRSVGVFSGGAQDIDADGNVILQKTATKKTAVVFPPAFKIADAKKETETQKPAAKNVAAKTASSTTSAFGKIDTPAAEPEAPAQKPAAAKKTAAKKVAATTAFGKIDSTPATETPASAAATKDDPAAAKKTAAKKVAATTAFGKIDSTPAPAENVGAEKTAKNDPITEPTDKAGKPKTAAAKKVAATEKGDGNAKSEKSNPLAQLAKRSSNSANTHAAAMLAAYSDAPENTELSDAADEPAADSAQQSAAKTDADAAPPVPQNERIVGWKLRKKGSEKWTSGANIEGADGEFAWGGVLAQLQINAVEKALATAQSPRHFAFLMNEQELNVFYRRDENGEITDLSFKQKNTRGANWFTATSLHPKFTWQHIEAKLLENQHLSDLQRELRAAEYAKERAKRERNFKAQWYTQQMLRTYSAPVKQDAATSFDDMLFYMRDFTSAFSSQFAVSAPVLVKQANNLASYMRKTPNLVARFRNFASLRKSAVAVVDAEAVKQVAEVANSNSFGAILAARGLQSTQQKPAATTPTAPKADTAKTASGAASAFQKPAAAKKTAAKTAGGASSAFQKPAAKKTAAKKTAAKKTAAKNAASSTSAFQKPAAAAKKTAAKKVAAKKAPANLVAGSNTAFGRALQQASTRSAAQRNK